MRKNHQIVLDDHIRYTMNKRTKTFKAGILKYTAFMYGVFGIAHYPLPTIKNCKDIDNKNLEARNK